jgi:hypothetical protein
MEKEKKLEVIIKESIFVDTEIAQPTALITIQGKIILNENSFITLSGLPKSRKTTIQQFILASCITGKSFYGIQANLNPEDKFILIDTEQSNYDFYRQNKFLKKLIKNNKTPDTFSAYLFREYDPEVTLQAIYQIVETEKPRMLFIDNLTELCNDPNNIVEAKKVIQLLKKMSAKFNIGIVCLLHLGKSNNFTLGNLGSYADRAAQSVLRVTIDKETDTTTLDCTMLRSDAHFNPITIQFNKETASYMEVEKPPEKSEKKSKSFSMDQFTDLELKARIDILYEMQSIYTYGSLVENLKKVFGVGDTKIKQVVIPYITHRKLIKIENKTYLKN